MTSLTGNMGPAGRALQGNSATASKQFKAPKGYNKFSQFSPEQQQLFEQSFSQVSPDSYLSKLAGGDQSTFEAMERPAWRQFQEAQGQLGSRFSQLSPGAMSAQRGSGFQNQASQASSDFAMNLQAQRQGLQRQALQDLRGFTNDLLGQQSFGLVEKPQKQRTNWAGIGGAALGGAGGFLLGGPAGAATGASVGYKVGSGR